MKRGRKPLPSHIRVVTGNAGKRPFNPDEPKPTVRIPDKPAELTDAGAVYWDEYAPMLKAMGVLTDADSQMLGMLCEYTAIWWDCISKVKDVGVVHNAGSEENPYITRNPFYTEAMKASDKMHRLLVEFGCSPSSRPGVNKE